MFSGGKVYRFYIFLTILASVLIFDIHARGCFVAIGYTRCYGHGKTWKRANKHYKANWTILQRLFWIPVFKENYANDFRLMAYFAYIQSVWAILTYLCFIISDLCFPESKFWIYEFIIYWIFSLIRFIHTDYTGRYGRKKINGKK